MTMRPLILVPGNALVVIDASSQGLWPIGSYPETSFEEISYDLPEEDFWPGTTDGLPVTQAEPGAIAGAPWLNASRLLSTNASGQVPWLRGDRTSKRKIRTCVTRSGGTSAVTIKNAAPSIPG